MRASQLLAICIFAFPSIVVSQVTLKQSVAKYSVVDGRSIRKGETMWEALVKGKRTGVTMIHLWQPDGKPKLISQFANRRGDVLFTVSNNFSDIGWTEWPTTFIYRKGRASLVSRDWLAAGLNDAGDILVSKPTVTYLPPWDAPYNHVTVFRAKIKGKSYALGVLAQGKLMPDGSVKGYWFEDSLGKRGNGHPEAEIPWRKRTFLWKQGQFTKVSP